MNISLQQLKEAVSIKERIQSLETQLAAILEKNSQIAVPTAEAPSKKGRSKMSAAARAKIAAAAKARWARIKGKAVPAKADAAPKKKRGLTPEGRARLAALMKARWAARKKGK